MSILNKIKKNTVVKDSIFEDKEPSFISTGCYALNILFSGKLNGGIQLGRISSIVAPPSLGKSFVGLKVAKNAQKLNMEVVYIDTEFAFDPHFAEKIGVDLDKMLVIQNNKIEDVLQVVASLPTDMTKEEKASILVIIDSWGGLVTSKTVADAIDGKDVSDMTIAKKKNSLARILNGIGTTSFVVNQTYECQTSNMKVRTAEGPKSIKDITYGDSVLTNEGYQNVPYIVSYENTPVYRLTLSDGTFLESTEEHKYMVNGKWNTVGNIKLFDKLTTVVRPQNNYLTVSKIEYIGNKTVYDIETPCHNYILENGIISHNSMNMYDPLAIGGGKGLTFCASSIVMGTSKAKSKDGDEISGAVITATNKKGRLAIENSKLKYLIKFNGGIHPYYGILEDALEGEYVVKPNQGWYTRPCVADDKKWREKEIWEKSAEFWDVIIQTTDFAKYIEKKYSFKHNYIIADDVMTIDEEDV